MTKSMNGNTVTQMGLSLGKIMWRSSIPHFTYRNRESKVEMNLLP